MGRTIHPPSRKRFTDLTKGGFPMSRVFDSPLTLLILLLVILLLFGASKLPGMARSLGQSLRIFKSELREMKGDQANDSGVANSHL